MDSNKLEASPANSRLAVFNITKLINEHINVPPNNKIKLDADRNTIPALLFSPIITLSKFVGYQYHIDRSPESIAKYQMKLDRPIQSENLSSVLRTLKHGHVFSSPTYRALMSDYGITPLATRNDIKPGYYYEEIDDIFTYIMECRYINYDGEWMVRDGPFILFDKSTGNQWFIGNYNKGILQNLYTRYFTLICDTRGCFDEFWYYDTYKGNELGLYLKFHNSKIIKQFYKANNIKCHYQLNGIPTQEIQRNNCYYQLWSLKGTLFNHETNNEDFICGVCSPNEIIMYLAMTPGKSRHVTLTIGCMRATKCIGPLCSIYYYDKSPEVTLLSIILKYYIDDRQVTQQQYLEYRRHKYITPLSGLLLPELLIIIYEYAGEPEILCYSLILKSINYEFLKH
jgi:hypothetical protein